MKQITYDVILLCMCEHNRFGVSGKSGSQYCVIVTSPGGNEALQLTAPHVRVCIVLYYFVLYCIVLYCTVLCCIVLYCIVLYCFVKYFIKAQ